MPGRRAGGASPAFAIVMVVLGAASCGRYGPPVQSPVVPVVPVAETPEAPTTEAPGGSAGDATDDESRRDRPAPVPTPPPTP